MLFDVQAALAEILSDPPRDTRDFCDMPTPVSQVSRVSQGGTSEEQKAPAPTNAPEQHPAPCPHGHSVSGAPRTWTGRVVSLDQWRKLSDWDRHGPDGRVWNGATQQWENPGEAPIWPTPKGTLCRKGTKIRGHHRKWQG